VQSLNFVVATLIAVLSDEDEAIVFRCAQALLFRHSLADFYRPRFPKLGVTVWQFDRIVEAFLPDVHTALEVHGITAEYYAMNWFLTLFASDLQQPVVRRVWDRFLIAGWQVVVQVGLALLKQVSDVLQSLDACESLTFLKKFVRIRRFEPEVLLSYADKFQVSHRMLSELEAAYGLENTDAAKLELKWSAGGELDWRVTRPSAKPCSGNDVRTAAPQVTVLPFLLHNLDTGETTVLEEEWKSYVSEEKQRPQTVTALNAALLPDTSAKMPSRNSTQATAKPATSGHQRSGHGGGSFWLEERQREALRALGKV